MFFFSNTSSVYSRVSAKYDWIKGEIDTFNSEGTNPPAPKLPGTCYGKSPASFIYHGRDNTSDSFPCLTHHHQTFNETDSPEFWYDSRGPAYNCGSINSCSDSFANGGITSNTACCDCGGGEIYNGPTVFPPPTTAATTTTTTTVPPLNCGEDSSFEIDILTDNYPAETTWTLTNTCDGSEVASGGPYNDPGTLYSERICVPDAQVYSLVMNDSWGDGIVSCLKVIHLTFNDTFITFLLI